MADPTLVTVVKDTASYNEAKAVGYGDCDMRVYPTGARAGETTITTNYRGLIFKTKVVVYDTDKNITPVDCKRCGFKCNDWYTEHGLDVTKWWTYGL